MGVQAPDWQQWLLGAVIIATVLSAVMLTDASIIQQLKKDSQPHFSNMQEMGLLHILRHLPAHKQWYFSAAYLPLARRVNLGISLLAIVFLRQRHFALTERAMLWPDMLGLGLFAAVGVDMAAEQGLPALICVMMGVITGVFGGVLRDVMCGEIPQAFRDHQPYAVCAFVGGWVDLLLRSSPVPEMAPMLGCVFVTAGLRAIALWRHWRLPSWRVD
ncbi:MAG: TRIC cation channel family protein [Comamonas sp.]